MRCGSRRWAVSASRVAVSIAGWAAASAARARVSVLRLTHDEVGGGIETVAAFHAFGEACRRELPLALARREHLRERLLRDARERLRAGELSRCYRAAKRFAYRDGQLGLRRSGGRQPEPAYRLRSRAPSELRHAV